MFLNFEFLLLYDINVYNFSGKLNCIILNVNLHLPQIAIIINITFFL